MPLGAMKLADDARDSEARGVGMETNREIRIEMTKDGGRGKTAFEFLKGFLSLRRPVELLIFAEKSRYRAGNARISLDKTTIKIGEAQKDLDILNGGGNRPIYDGCDTTGFHRNTIR